MSGQAWTEIGLGVAAVLTAVAAWIRASTAKRTAAAALRRTRPAPAPKPPAPPAP